MFNEFKKLFAKPFIIDDQHIVHNEIGMDISTAKMADMDDLMRLQKLVYPVKQPWTRQTYIYELTRRNNVYLLVKTEDHLIGVLGISKHNRHEAHITNIAILPNFQDQGLGHLLLNIGFKIVQQRDFNKLTLEVDAQNLPAIKLYKSLGFYETKTMKNYYDNGHDGLELCKQINK